jgi:hypothetical protein
MSIRSIILKNANTHDISHISAFISNKDFLTCEYFLLTILSYPFFPTFLGFFCFSQISGDFSVESMFNADYLFTYPDYLHPDYPLNICQDPTASL